MDVEVYGMDVVGFIDIGNRSKVEKDYPMNNMPNNLTSYMPPASSVIGAKADSARRIAAAYKAGFYGCFVTKSGPEWMKKLAVYDRDFFRSNSQLPWKASEVIPQSFQGAGTGKRSCNWNFILAINPKALSGSQDFGNCFPAGTIVRLANGSHTAIQNICVDWNVITAEGNIGRVIRTIARSTKEPVWRLSLGGYQVLRATGTHKILTTEGYKEIQTLKAGEEVITLSPFSNSRCPKKIESIKEEQFSGTVYNLEVEEDHSYVAEGIGVSNCTAWATREGIEQNIGVDIAIKKDLHAYRGRTGTAIVYGSRQSSRQGMTLSRAMWAIQNYGFNSETVYLDGKYDFRQEDTDEAYGNKWGRTGPPTDLINVTKVDRIAHVVEIANLEEAMDALYGGASIIHGSTLTGSTKGELISSLVSIGGHAQALLGYDDTDEFREWYEKSTGKKAQGTAWVGDQSWGANWNNFPIQLWPTHLWGERPEGAWVLWSKDMDKVIRQWGDCYAFSEVEGLVRDGIPDWTEAFSSWE